MVMFLSISVVTGFQNEVREKVIGFGSHIQILPIQLSTNADEQPMEKDQPFVADIHELSEVKFIQPYAARPAIIQVPTDTIEEDDNRVEYSIQGLLLKGGDEQFHWDFLEEKLKSGHIPKELPDSLYPEMLISQHVSDRLYLETGDTMDVYFIRNGKPIIRKYTLSGIYQSGLEEFDKEFAFTTLSNVQHITSWGSQVYLELKDTCLEGSYVLQASSGDQAGYAIYNFGDGWDTNPYYRLCPVRDTTIMVLGANWYPGGSSQFQYPEPQTIPDTAWLSIRVQGNAACNCPVDPSFAIPAEYGDDGFFRKLMPDSSTIITTQLRTSGGTQSEYITGYEITLNDYEQIPQVDDHISRKVIGPGFETHRIDETYMDIFGWLEMLDVNVIIIISLLVTVAIVSMSSVMLVLILERTNAIGILKAMGATNWNIRKVFIYQTAWLTGIGLVVGNILGLGIALFQMETGFFKLNEQMYYLSAIPMEIDWILVMTLNLGTILLCLVMLVLPSWMVARIRPVRAIKFN